MLRFSLPGVPVTVHWSFAIVAFFALNRFAGWQEIAAWTIAVFVAVTLHESGHAFSAKAYGATDVSITLFALGGYTTWVPKSTMGPGKRFVVSAAGSALGIVAGLLILWFGRGGLFTGFPSWGIAFLDTFVLVGLFWGVLNWIPLLPLDGGHMLQHGLSVFWPRQAPKVALAVSTVIGVVLTGAALFYGQTFMAIFLIFILVSGWRSRPQSTPEIEQPLPPIEPYPPAQPTLPADRDPEPPAFPI